MVAQSDNKIIVGGKFSNYNGSFANRIVRINGVALGTAEFSKNALMLYPNPVKELLYLGLGLANVAQSYEIYDIMGRKTEKRELLENHVNVSTLSNGVYVLKVQTSEGVLTSRFIKE